MKWIEALKLYNKGKGMWCIAKKGTPEYDEVKKIMNRDKAPAVAERNKERSQKSLEQLKGEASKSEARRAEARKKYEEKVKEMEHHKTASVPPPAPARPPAPGNVPDAVVKKLHDQTFIKKSYPTDAEFATFIEKINDVLNGKGDEIKNHTLGEDPKKVYDLGYFASGNFPKNANNTNIPKATDALIAKIPNGKWSLFIYDTGDSDGYGRWNDVIMVLVNSA